MIYQRCSGQLIMDMGGPVDINILAVKLMMEMESVEDQRECLHRVQILASNVIGEQRKEAAAEAKRRKQAG
jgi:hypothetical protein